MGTLVRVLTLLFANPLAGSAPVAVGEFDPSAYTTWATMTWVSPKDPAMLHEGNYTVQWSGAGLCSHPGPPWFTNDCLGTGSLRVLGHSLASVTPPGGSCALNPDGKGVMRKMY
jgi:hypothetical protein